MLSRNRSVATVHGVAASRPLSVLVVMAISERAVEPVVRDPFSV